MNAISKKSIAALGIGLTLLTGAGASFADDPDKRISFADLDLNRPAHVAELYGRITEAARMVCRESASPWDGRQQRTFEACVQGAVAQAVMDVNVTALTSLYAKDNEKLASR